MTMIRACLAVIAVLLTAASTTSAQPAAVDATVGVSDSAMKGLEPTFSQPTMLSAQVGLTAGFAVPVSITRWLAFEPEMVYAQKRYTYTTPDTENFGGPLSNMKTRLDY